ncbi:AAA domain, putative AbiEii toxin, Type IV TA system [anaerobic digester metagenome]
MLSLGAKLRIKEFSNIRNWFINNEIIDFGDIYENAMRGRSLPDSIYHDKTKRNNVVKYLNSFTKSMIKDLELTEEIDDENENKYSLESIHFNKSTGYEAKLAFSDESSGTQKMFALYQPIKDALKNGSLLLVDEMNARLHPLLIRSIIQVFADQKKNPKNAQLIMTSHDAWLLEDNIFRRDEIWFSEKNSDEETELYSLSDFEDINGNKIRSDENYMRNYLLGKYGGIPDFNELQINGEDDDEEYEDQ